MFVRRFVLVVCFMSAGLKAQDVSVLIGLGQNQYFDCIEASPHYNSLYEKGRLISTRIGLSDIKFKDIRFSVLFGIQSFESSLEVSSGGLGGNNTVDVDMEKTLFTFGFYPVKRTLIEGVSLELGLLYSRLINEFYVGRRYGWVVDGGVWDDDETEHDYTYSLDGFWSAGAQVSYEIPLRKRLDFLIQLSGAYSLSNEFKSWFDDTKAFRCVLAVGLKVPLK